MHLSISALAIVVFAATGCADSVRFAAVPGPSEAHVSSQVAAPPARASHENGARDATKASVELPRETTASVAASAVATSSAANAFEQVDTQGTLPAEQIRYAVRAQMPQFAACADASVKRPDGVMNVRFRIAKDGHVRDPKTSTEDIRDEVFRRCVADAFAKVRFPRPSGGEVTVVYPLSFRAHAVARSR